ncbi:hypothetical protein FGG08_001823 [Glutinoglossum americanum]|uniref:Gag1-like clamp domain-containing protein n=1 Tax=Glutinoglossum americanum TaxID=1670608 RepID=A0A9P8I671_9PEZI|nr:hypothetical protein FGG08_001823 [Glutinoglossum americanum]
MSSSSINSDRQRLIQATRREIAAKVRDDWEWPPVVIPVPPPPPLPPKRHHKKSPKPGVPDQPHHSDGGGAEAAGDNDAEGEDDSTSTTSSEEEEFSSLPPPRLAPPAPKSWVPRTIDSSPSTSPQPSPPSSPYRFEHPDSIGPTISAQLRAHRTKRRKLLEEEMTWNDGLRCWSARRDAWSGARTLDSDAVGEAGNLNGEGGAPTATAPVTPPESPTLVPLALPLHSLHPPPGNLPPHTHPQIYAKIVLKSQTPSVPINLRDLTAALVQGWKDDDMWPPRPQPVMSGGGGLGVGGSGGTGMAGRNGTGTSGRKAMGSSNQAATTGT